MANFSWVFYRRFYWAFCGGGNIIDIAEIISNSWFWTFWGTAGAYLMLAMKRKKIALPFFGDVATAYFGITFFLIGFMVQFNFMEKFINASHNVGIGIFYNIIIFLLFIFNVRALASYKWFKPIAFMITAFTTGILARSLYTIIWGG